MKIMFQGDSVTDAGRNRENNAFLAGYSQRIKDILGEKHEYRNYANGGETSYMMVGRHGFEFKKEKPDVLILLIGINDLWRKYGAMNYQALPIDKTIDNIKKTIKISKDINPQCKIILLEPFVTPGPSNLFEDSKEDFPILQKSFRENLPSLVDKYIILNDILNAEYQKGNVLLYDGVHPSVEGHTFIGNYIVENCNNIFNSVKN